jgi:hypothetical protein
MKELENTKTLNAVERADAIARIARHLGKKECKPDCMTMHFTNDEDVDNGREFVYFTFSKELKGFNTFDGKQFIDIPDMKVYVKVTSPIDELNDYRILAMYADKKVEADIPEPMRQPLLNKLSSDVRAGLLEVSLLPFTRSKSKSK